MFGALDRKLIGEFQIRRAANSATEHRLRTALGKRHRVIVVPPKEMRKTLVISERKIEAAD